MDVKPADQQGPTAPVEQFDELLKEALRTPLDRIIESAERISGRADGPVRSDYAAYAADISGAARHLLSVIHSMGEQPCEKHGTVDLAALAAEAVVLLEPTAEERAVTMVVEASRPLPANGEESSVIQILVNLIGNAVRHSPSGGTVALRFRRLEQQSCVIVLDEGRGIDAADQERIFERFERANPGEGGTGLGLAISRRLARSMGGDIEVESAPNAGARFTLRLPSA
jgi:signal transduction histidine kinase